MAAADNDKSLSIDLLRAICVLYIVGFWHLMDYTYGFAAYDNAATNRLTVIVLGLFTFLSGFLLAQAPLRLCAPELRRFYTKRFLRIYPLYLLALLGFWAVGLADRGIALKAALGLSMAYGPPPNTLWFITMILVFYLVAPLLIALRDAPLKFLLASLALFALTLLAGLGASGDIRIAEYFPAFALGIHWAGRGRGAPMRSAGWASAAAIAACALSLAFAGNPQFSLAAAPLATFGALAVFLLAARLPLPRDGGLARAIGLLSYASFAMYLFHRIVYKGLHTLVDPASSVLGLLFLLLVGLPVAVVVGYAVQKVYDAARQRLTTSLAAATTARAGRAA